MSKVVVGIDVSKDYSSAQGLDREGKKLFYLDFPTNGEGFSRFLNMVKMHVKDLSQVTVAMESTGCYHINLFAFLCSEGIACVVINPLLIANFARLSLRKTKTDKKDALTIAQFLLAHQLQAFAGLLFTKQPGSEGSGQRAGIAGRDDRWVKE